MPLAVRAQEQPAPPPPQAAQPAAPQPGAMIKKESKLVLVDAVVTDKKGNYIHDLSQVDFKVYEDNKEQPVSAFSAGVDAATQVNGQRRYLILFFDNSTMAMPDQIQARGAAKKFIEANAGPDRMMAVVDFGGSLRIVQNFTANANLLQAAVSGVKSSSVDPNAPAADAPVTVASAGLPSLGNAAADFGARSMLLAVRSLAKNLRSIPGRKMVVLFSGGFPLTSENQSELTATIDACNKSNVAVYALDARGLTAPIPGGSARRNTAAGKTHAVSNRPSNRRASARPRILLAAFPASAMPDPQRPGGGGGGQGGGVGGVEAWVGGGAGVAVVVQAVAVQAAVVAERVEAAGAALEELAAAPAAERVEAPEAAVLVERVVAPEVGPAGEREVSAAGDMLPATTTHLPIANRERSCRNFQPRLRRTSRYLRPSRKERADSPSSIPTTCSAAWSASDVSRMSFTFWDMCRRTRRKEAATR
jgi:VWFA-related protein